MTVITWYRVQFDDDPTTEGGPARKVAVIRAGGVSQTGTRYAEGDALLVNF